MAHPPQYPASFTSSQEDWKLWEKELTSCISLYSMRRKLNPHKQIIVPYSNHTGMVLFVIEFNPSHPMLLDESFGWVFSWD